ncbi:MAG TPA: AzlD domain-containing protein [Sphaerochaeta sp.]|jgi:branched-subunit amino acid transport protein|nr:AzlD domain-containing protein [Spirochaetota bacterium]HOE84713.1 AzlD domain-containing protein [Sphaerochaeta sp.]HOQ94795.1 AzlD domain-containing protein [Sphaerochaeta sp.]HPK46365.1 AzlD domain-containing protein [Sphaerochaeta sp.]HPY12037.1 AzlD domain-containing protein [Sphaerochaeta sp.]
MMNPTVAILISALATIITRLLPYYAGWLERLPRFFAKSLRLLPIAALGPLIFPGVLLDYPDRWWAGLGGIAIASLFAWRKNGMIIPILLSIATTWALLAL